ncbi:polysaccharide biosynthesis protein [Marinobacterium lutimaris]|uniref:NDP-sugar epimerase, includes UDP-GlcNAc-inverting 4,6-dehydratase FlaA1 and capsular polysaccharide biosynthesis protein EpsC n=1 Tax=Marinobacterium lutimaris TaxID=568106 RepID=A0A1H6B8E9_9GAMM|nr:nucleoside-diphosphate sugar epimerase/dehydratase [Marinobacterium lutimaris]SEG57078.1 NDP-sugar epimerase, includes UDP-GlcNAc-inverting 4,6-dehydratase FlaA1 and capsular polysaccharide biosynthesis protein EpsC [Marinobacterium lutimaris]
MDQFNLPTRSLHHRVMTLNRGAKKLIMLLADLVALPLALWSAYALRLADWWPVEFLAPGWWLFLFTPVLGVIIFIRLGLYRAVVHFMGAQAISAVAKGVVLLAVGMWAAAYLSHIAQFPRSVPVIFALVALVYVGGSRLLVRNYYHALRSRYVNKSPVLIYGAGHSGVQLAGSLSSGAEFEAVGFLDDDKSLSKGNVAGMPVYSPAVLGKLIEELKVSHVLLALPSVSIKQRRRILEKLAEYPIRVKTVPSMMEIIAGTSMDALRDVDPEDLLGRDAVPPMPGLIAGSIRGKSVLVSGAGGSIGSEICRQVLANQPKALVLYEVSEYALYTIEQELSSFLTDQGLKIPLYPVLGSVVDGARVANTLSHFGVNTIYHAAAYKHVPLVEHNVLEGLRNNVLGTRVLAQKALGAGVERFVLVSTDKAVRPTNVMGATKRMAELVLQDMAASNPKTTFSMVRFGNVLGSSGSVVPLFRRQIETGGPVTVTHPEITRFFMTIPEAASLVIQAGTLAQGGEIFVLDMGKSVRIVDLARRMIKLMGHEIRNADTPGGDIEIVFSGLRPGEKLYEELLIGEDVVGTEHPKIMRAQEERLTSDKLADLVQSMEQALAEGSSEDARALLQQGVSGFKPSSPMVDWLYTERSVSELRH